MIYYVQMISLNFCLDKNYSRSHKSLAENPRPITLFATKILVPSGQ